VTTPNGKRNRAAKEDVDYISTSPNAGAGDVIIYELNEENAMARAEMCVIQGDCSVKRDRKKEFSCSRLYRADLMYSGVCLNGSE
jgi:hypothetical protein